MHRSVWLPVALMIVSAPHVAAAGQVVAIELPARARGAERVVVASIEHVQPTYDLNEFGDNLIVSRTVARVSEVLKGDGVNVGQVLDIDVEGGTVGDVTLRVSDMPAVVAGEQAVFFLVRNKRGRLVPYQRGLGILKLDRSGQVLGSALGLDDLRPLLRGR